MQPAIELVDGVSFASEASRILEEAWSIPGIRYTPEYVRWQFGFPAPRRLPAVAAFAGNEAIGFAGVTARRLRCQAEEWDSGIVSFVAVRPGWRKRGIAGALYAKLLDTLRRLEGNALTFGIPDSIGDLTLRRAYTEARFEIRPLGFYPNYGFLVRGAAPMSAWKAEISDDLAALPGIIARCAGNPNVIWSAPDQAQLEHYRRDPRPRKFVLLQQSGSGVLGAAWIVRSEFRGPSGSGVVTTADCIWLPTPDPAALPVLCHAAAAAWPDPSGKPVVISAPNLAGFDTSVFRSIGLRETGGRFLGYFCTAKPAGPVAPCVSTNMEIV